MTDITITKDVNRILGKVDLSPMCGKSVLVTGGTGLLGTYFIECLKKVPDISIASVSKRGADDLEVDSIEWDMASVDSDASYNVRNIKYDYIIHAAGYGQPEKFMDDPMGTIAINTSALRKLFTNWLGRDPLNTGKLLFVSTSEVYSGLTGMCKEEQVGITNTTHPRACYIEGKRCGEAIVNAWRDRVDAKSVRLALAYGPGTKPNDTRVLNEFIQRGIQEGEVRVQGDGTGRRTYCYISDAMEMMLNILLPGKEPIYNVGGIEAVTINELASMIGDILNVGAILPKEEKGLLWSKGAPKDVGLNLSLYERDFGKKEFVSLEEGLTKTIEYQKQLYATN